MSAQIDFDFEYEAYWHFLVEKERLERLIDLDLDHDYWIHETSNTVH